MITYEELIKKTDDEELNYKHNAVDGIVVNREAIIFHILKADFEKEFDAYRQKLEYKKVTDEDLVVCRKGRDEATAGLKQALTVIANRDKTIEELKGLIEKAHHLVISDDYKRERSGLFAYKLLAIMEGSK